MSCNLYGSQTIAPYSNVEHIYFAVKLKLSPPVTLFTDKNRQELTRAVKRRQEAFLCIFLLKYYLLDHIYVLYIQISHMVAFAAPQNNEFTTLQIALLTDKKFCEAVLAVYVGCHRDFSVIPKTA